MQGLGFRGPSRSCKRSMGHRLEGMLRVCVDAVHLAGDKRLKGAKRLGGAVI